VTSSVNLCAIQCDEQWLHEFMTLAIIGLLGAGERVAIALESQANSELFSHTTTIEHARGGRGYTGYTQRDDKEAVCSHRAEPQGSASSRVVASRKISVYALSPAIISHFTRHSASSGHPSRQQHRSAMPDHLTRTPQAFVPFDYVLSLIPSVFMPLRYAFGQSSALIAQ